MNIFFFFAYFVAGLLVSFWLNERRGLIKPEMGLAALFMQHFVIPLTFPIWLIIEFILEIKNRKTKNHE